MNQTATSSAVRRLLPLGLGLALIAYVARRLGVRDIIGMLGHLRWSVAPVLTLYAGHQMARAAALTWCVAPRYGLGFFDALWIRLAGEAVEFLTFTGPIVAEPTKAWLLQRQGLEVSEALAATLLEYLASTVAAAMTAVIGLGYLLTVIQPVGPVRVAAIIVLVGLSAFLGIVGIAVAARVRIVGTVVGALTRRTHPALESFVNALWRTARETPGRLAAIMSLEFVAQTLLGLELWTLLAGVRLSCAIGRAMSIEGVMKFLNVGFFVPGQVGVAEGSYAVVFGVFGLPAAAGVTIALARRLRSLVTALVGFIALVTSGIERRPRRRRLDDVRRECGTDGHRHEQHCDSLVLERD
jgi:hypothetical protein